MTDPAWLYRWAEEYVAEQDAKREPELAPCNWCPSGGNPKVRLVPETRDDWAIVCDECGAQGPCCGTEEQAIAAWSRRASGDAVEALAADNRRLSIERQMLLDEREGSVWIWQGDGSDHPESQSCPTLVHPEDLRKLCASGWVSVAERNPDREGWYPVTRKTAGKTWYRQNWYPCAYEREIGWVCNDVECWYEMPEPPEE